MKSYEEMMKFLDYMIQKNKQEALDCVGLKNKLTIQRYVLRLEHARKEIRLLFYEYEDWILLNKA